MNTLNALELVSLFASIASLVLAVVAIWLSLAFFKMSSALTEKSTEAAKAISSGVEKLEELFDKLYADTFSMMRDTVSDMRRHIWPETDAGAGKVAQEAEKRAEQKVSALKATMEQEIGHLLQKQKLTDDSVASLKGEMSGLLDRVIAGSRQLEAEAREETVRDTLLSSIRSENRRHPGRNISVASSLSERGGWPA